jgi:hypothetical protein
VHFTDRDYTDNHPADAPGSAPLFALYGESLPVDKALQPGESCLSKNEDGSYSIGLAVKNVSRLPRPMTMSLSGPGLTVSNNPQSWTLNPGQTAVVWFNATATQKNIVATLRFDVYGGFWGNLLYDLTPTVIVDSIRGIGIDHNCSPEQQRVDCTWHSTGFPADDPTGLKVLFALGGDISAVNYWGTCAAQNPVLAGLGGCALGGYSGFSCNVVTSATRPPSVQVQITWEDGVTVIQSSTYTVPCVWT